MKRVLSVLIVLVAVSLTLAAQRSDNRQVEWLYYGGDPGGMKYSTLTDINPGNVQRLQKVWEWTHWETPMEEYGTIPGFFEATPLMIDGVLYVTTPYNSVAALDAETGRRCGDSTAKTTSSGKGCRVGVTADPARALAWFRKAAEQGNAAAQNNIGFMYEIGRAVSLDYAEAVKWYRKSAEQGWAAAQASLGLLYSGGAGVPQDVIEADMWFQLATLRAVNDDERDKYDRLRETLEAKMSVGDIIEARQRAREWIRRFAQVRKDY